eukprot:6212516-Pleurochrysis_carterae.AAC.2
MHVRRLFAMRGGDALALFSTSDGVSLKRGLPRPLRMTAIGSDWPPLIRGRAVSVFWSPPSYCLEQRRLIV